MQAQIVDVCHNTLVWVLPQLDKFPRNRRFTLGEKIENNLLDVLALSTQAVYAKRERANMLQRAKPTTGHCASFMADCF